MKLTGLSAVIFGLSFCSSIAQNSEIVIADFEGANYGNWTVMGTAFGGCPASGTLPGQMAVESYRGSCLVNSFHGGDDSTGTLTSPSFKIERKFLQFLIGGGGWEGKTCMNLLVDGKIVRTATGPNTRPGGSEHLDTQQWHVAEFLGKSAVIQIVDQATGSWGHINVDQIVQTDIKIPGLIIVKNATQTLLAQNRYLNLPVKTGAPKRQLTVLVDGKVEREFDIELAPRDPDWHAFMDLVPFKGKEITIKVDQIQEDSVGWKSIGQSDEIKGHENLYREALRPQFHFTSRRGWLNDPNGLVFYGGEYHLFYQHNPYGWDWGNMHWGHAVSTDLVHWKELPVALYPDQHGTMFSGSAVVDWNNTAGFQAGNEKTLVTIFTAAGRPFTQGIAFSNDRGRTWAKYDKNPVLPHIAAENRDPKVIWYAPENKWIMALYLDRSDYALFSSADLKKWEKLCDVTIPGDSECPEFFQMAVDNNKQETHWIFYGANGRYLIGNFDGKTFTPVFGPHDLQHGNCWYASQTFTDIPSADGRRILIPWGRMTSREMPFHQGMPFNQMMGIPVELKLHSTDEGLRLSANPVKELESLRGRSQAIKAQVLNPGDNPLQDVKVNREFEMLAELAIGDASEIVFDLRGLTVAYNAKKQELSCENRKASLKPVNGKIRLRLLVDRTSVDVFGNDGQLYMAMGRAISRDNNTLKLSCKGGNAQITSLRVYELESAWK